ncbi:single-stranded DNA-binding protein, mitochondrial [Penaeus vannamei]|uniref:Putative single-stranded DNA-binding protein, mitochondrial n=1 Tax=Penaeus vannamei TaxID=6689 RepID=A0A3R7LZV7_PENVA|nr:single-stranded DNA-binding protein, mitochondrial-like [Penaeus vannamei]ROT69109.1 putative single-stranded DNA-binding protein, mitochondrial [Penaeus vannamei]
MLKNAVAIACKYGLPGMKARPLHTATANLFENDMQTQKVERLEKTINQVMLLGRVGADPEKRGTEQHPVVTFSIATHTNYRKGEDLIQQTDWHRIAVFKPYLRETVYRYLTKGQRVLVQGRLGYLERRDPENNSIVMKSATIVADDVVFFNKGEGNTGIY